MAGLKCHSVHNSREVEGLETTAAAPGGGKGSHMGVARRKHL